MHRRTAQKYADTSKEQQHICRNIRPTMFHLILKGLDTQTSFARFRRDVRALFSLLSLLIKFTRDLTAQEARKS
ncbi:hypothetical protein [Sphingobium sp. Z007]|uniref:hypothetical protein n=1 Tax=Sphingobium sp. Z007 TaxID=627495 RepID=UPI00159628EA|nr:hypothetical protein [Sphingobium sp. Z007]